MYLVFQAKTQTLFAHTKTSALLLPKLHNVGISVGVRKLFCAFDWDKQYTLIFDTHNLKPIDRIAIQGKHNVISEQYSSHYCRENYKEYSSSRICCITCKQEYFSLAA
jgi:hypothetical protein